MSTPLVAGSSIDVEKNPELTNVQIQDEIEKKVPGIWDCQRISRDGRIGSGTLYERSVMI